MHYSPKGVCSSGIDFEIKDGIVEYVKFKGGCSGNTQGVAALVEGMPVEKAIQKLKGIRCGVRPTSCPDQLARAFESALSEN